MIMMIKKVTSQGKTYCCPLRATWIQRREWSEKLYKLEEARDSAIEAAAQELGRVLSHTETEFYTRTLPESLLNVLSGFDPHASEVACMAFLINSGYKCEKEGASGATVDSD